MTVLFSLVMVACSGSSSSSNTTAVETCYKVQVSYAVSNISQNICTTKENGGYNGLGVNRFIRFSLASTSTVSIQVIRTSGLNPADPDIYLYSHGTLINSADSTQSNTELMTASNLAAGEYVVELSEYVYQATIDKTAFYKDNLANVEKSREVVYQAPSSCANSVSDPVVSGRVTFDRVNHNGNSLDYSVSGITVERVQQAVVEVICGNGIAYTGFTNANGDYSIKFPSGQPSFVRVRAQMKQTASSSWDISIVDNTTSGQPTYVMDMDSVFTLTIDNPNTDLHAISGWTGTSYGSARVAAPFAILDSVRKAKDKILAVAPTATFPLLKINWSVNNTTASGDLAAGRIGTSFYDGSEIYLLGAEDNDTDEYDEHVIIHEWGHYFEDKFSRTDSIGGPHTSADILDIRVAFSEGFGNAFSAIVTDVPLYIDTSGLDQGAGFSINMENNTCANAGWYSECSVQSVLYDIYDTNNEPGDTLSLPFMNMYTVFTGKLKTTAAMTSVFSFIKPFKDQNSANSAAIDSLTSAQNINPVLDIYGDSEISNNPGSTNQLPIYELF